MNQDLDKLGSGNVDASAALEEAKRLLAGIKARNFTDFKVSAMKVLDASTDMLKTSAELMNKTKVLQDEVKKIDGKFEDFLEILLHIKDAAKAGVARVLEAEEVINKTKAIDYKVINQ